MGPEMDDNVGDMPVRTNYQINDQQRFPCPRKDSVISFSPSTTSKTPIMMGAGDKLRSISQSSYAESSSSTGSAEDRVQITKLKLYIKVGLGVLIPVVVILSIAVIYLFIAVHTLNNIQRYPDGRLSNFGKQTGGEEKEPLCIECKKLQFTLDSENIILDKLKRKTEAGKQICCAETAEQIDIFMKRYFDAKLKEERASGGLCMGTSAGLSGPDFRNRRATSPQDGARCTTSQNPSVHLIGTDEMGGDDLNNGPSVINKWADNSDIAFRNSVSFNKKTGALTVPKSGFYYVYSQIHFIQIYPRVSRYPNSEERGAYDRTPNSNSLTHTIKRTHERYYPEEMLKRRQSQCWVTNKLYSEYTSYMGGIMNLRQGDEIYVEVSNKSMISSQSKMNFFGLFYVAPNERP